MTCLISLLQIVPVCNYAVMQHCGLSNLECCATWRIVQLCVLCDFADCPIWSAVRLCGLSNFECCATWRIVQLEVLCNLADCAITECAFCRYCIWWHFLFPPCVRRMWLMSVKILTYGGYSAGTRWLGQILIINDIRSTAERNIKQHGRVIKKQHGREVY